MSVTAQEEKKFVAFQLSGEHYAIDVHRVSEVFVPNVITNIPNAPSFIAGVINFRGNIVSVIDLTKRLSITKKVSGRQFEEDEERLYVIIVRSGDATIGLLVDYVESVISISDSNVQSTIDLISDTAKTAFLNGVARTELGLTIILNLDTILSEYDAAEVEKLAQIRERLASETESDEVVVTSEQLVDLDEDDISEYEKASSSSPEFKEVSFGGSGGGLGSSPLDLNELTKAELLKIALEMEIDTVSTRSNKQEIIDAINSKMGS